MKKRLLSMILAVSMVLTFLPVSAITAFAADDATESGTTSTGATWKLEPNGDDTYTIVFSGNGEIGSLKSAPSVGYDAITKAVLNDGITKISYNTFSSMKNLTSVVVPASLNTIDGSAFSYHTKLEEITTTGNSSNSAAAGMIGSSAFSGCTKLKTVDLRNFVDSIDGSIVGCFSSCTSLETLYLYGKNGKIGDGSISYFKSSLKYFRTRKAITEIGDSAFENCSKLDTILLGKYGDNLTSKDNHLDQVETIGQKAFSGCTSLKNLRIHYTVKSIGHQAFNNSGLTSIKIESAQGVSVGDFAFSSCKSLESVEISDTVKSIGMNAFDGCSSLNYVKMSKKTGTIGANAFKDCNSLTSINYMGTEAEWNARTDRGNIGKRANFAHTVTYMDGETKKTSYTVEFGADRQIYSKPTKSGYTLKCWKYTDSNDGEHFTDDDNGKVTNVTEDLTLYAVWLKNVMVPENVTITAGDTPVTPDSNVIKVDPDAEITLTVNDPKYRDTYEWFVNDSTKKDTEHVSEDGKTFTITADSTLNKIGLAVTHHETYDANDFTVTGLKDYTYGDTIDVKVTPKDESVTDYKVEYVKDAGTDEESKSEELPTEVGTYTVRITKGDTVINIPQTFAIKPRTSGVSIKSGVLQKVVLDEEDITTSITKDADGKYSIPENAEVTVTFDKDAFADSNLKFSYWNITGLSDEEAAKYNKQESFTFTMPATGVTLEAMTQDATIEDEGPDILGTAAIITTAAVGGAVLAWQGYQIGTELYLTYLLPAGAAIPANTAELAKLVWTEAGKPAPAALLAEDATEEQQAMAWAVENDLIDADKAADASVSRTEVIKTWKKAQSVKQG